MKVSGGEFSTSINSSRYQKKSPENNFRAFKLKYEKYQIDILNLQKKTELS